MKREGSFGGQYHIQDRSSGDPGLCSLPDTETQRERRTGLSCKPFRAIDRAVLDCAVYLSAF